MIGGGHGKASCLQREQWPGTGWRPSGHCSVPLSPRCGRNDCTLARRPAVEGCRTMPGTISDATGALK
ncbi:hypothetical protein D3C83_39760 [compost metagenome]